MKNRYVILTGSKNNAGDFLIKHRAKQLFKVLRSDREIIDYNAWEYLDNEKLDVVNNSKALILMGGPALQKNMYPGIYKLRDNLDDIKVPIIMMGIGWKSLNGEWKDTYDYPLSKASLKLLEKIENSGYYSSVRDYHTLNVLSMKGFDKFLMTGCPAYYDLNYIGKEINVNNVKKVAFSLGVSFINSTSMEILMKDIILKLRDKFNGKEFEVVFHHSLNKKLLIHSGSGSYIHLKKHKKFEEWLIKNNINYIDISGSAENLINYYSNIDLHIGFRVHAHIFMNSISKFSILLSEDGRAKAVRDVIGGIVLDGYLVFKDNILLRKFFSKLIKQDRYTPNKNILKELMFNLNYAEKVGFVKIKNSRKMIDNNFNIMKQFIKQLP